MIYKGLNTPAKEKFKENVAFSENNSYYLL